MLSWYKYQRVILVFFPSLGLWSVNFVLIVSFPDHCLLDLFTIYSRGRLLFKHMHNVKFRGQIITIFVPRCKMRSLEIFLIFNPFVLSDMEMQSNDWNIVGLCV